MKVKKEKSTEQRLRCPVLFSHAWGEAPPACLGVCGRRECEDFAPRNEDTRVRGERGAKRGGRRSRGRVKSGGGNVKILLPGTKPQGLARSGEQRDTPAGFMPGSREPCNVLHLGNPVRYRRVPAERYRGLHTGSGNLPPGFPHPRRSWNRNPGF